MEQQIRPFTVLFCGHTMTKGFEYTAQELSGDPTVQVVRCPLEEVPARVASADVLIPLMARLDASALMSASPARGGRCRLVLQYGVGLEGVDVGEATRLGIWVSNIPSRDTGNALSCAEHALYLCLGLLRDQRGLAAAVADRRLGEPCGETLFGKRVLVVGFGNIARELIARLQPFGVEVSCVRGGPWSEEEEEQGEQQHKDDGDEQQQQQHKDDGDEQQQQQQHKDVGDEQQQQQRAGAGVSGDGANASGGEEEQLHQEELSVSGKGQGGGGGSAGVVPRPSGDHPCLAAAAGSGRNLSQRRSTSERTNGGVDGGGGDSGSGSGTGRRRAGEEGEGQDGERRGEGQDGERSGEGGGHRECGPSTCPAAAAAAAPSPATLARRLARKGSSPDLLGMVEDADIIILTCPQTAETRGMINSEVLERCKHGVRIVNVARGGLLDYGSTMAALQSGRIGGLGLDVQWEEPFEPEHPLAKHPRVLLTPHIAGVTELSYRSMARVVAREVRRARKGLPPTVQINRPYTVPSPQLNEADSA